MGGETYRAGLTELVDTTELPHVEVWWSPDREHTHLSPRCGGSPERVTVDRIWVDLECSTCLDVELTGETLEVAEELLNLVELHRRLTRAEEGAETERDDPGVYRILGDLHAEVETLTPLVQAMDEEGIGRGAREALLRRCTLLEEQVRARLTSAECRADLEELAAAGALNPPHALQAHSDPLRQLHLEGTDTVLVQPTRSRGYARAALVAYGTRTREGRYVVRGPREILVSVLLRGGALALHARGCRAEVLTTAAALWEPQGRGPLSRGPELLETAQILVGTQVPGG